MRICKAGVLGRCIFHLINLISPVADVEDLPVVEDHP